MFAGFCIVVGVIFSGFVCFVHNVKSLSTLLDRRKAMSAEGGGLVGDFGFRLRIHAYFQKVWPGLKKIGPESFMSSVYKVSVLGFFAVLVVCYAFPKIIHVAGPALLMLLGMFSLVGNALNTNEKTHEFGKLILVPVCAIVPLSIAYQVDSGDKFSGVKQALSQFSLPYSVVLLLGVIICFVAALVFIVLLERFQGVIVRAVLSRTLLLAKHLVLLGVVTTEPDEVEARAIAKDAVTASVATLSFMGIAVGGVVALIKLVL